MSDSNNKIVVVTGAARGIGRNIATKFAENGATTIVVDLDERASSTLIAKMHVKGCKIEFAKVDLRSNSEITQFIDDTFARYGTIDVVLHNARAGSRTLPLEENEENWDESFAVNLKAPLFFSQKYIDMMHKGNRAGCIVNISSVAADLICGESASYHLSKAGIENLTRYLAVYGGPKGVRVNAVQPGFIVHDEHKNRFWSSQNEAYRRAALSAMPLRKVGSSDDVANVCLFLASEAAAFVTGQIITVDGGLALQEQWNLIHSLSKSQSDESSS